MTLNPIDDIELEALQKWRAEAEDTDREVLAAALDYVIKAKITLGDEENYFTSKLMRRSRKALLRALEANS